MRDRRMLRWVVLLLTAALMGACSAGADQGGRAAGVWHVHTYYLTIGQHGNGTFRWPTHVFCGTGVGLGPPPCDGIDAHGEITDGGYARLSVTHMHAVDGDGTVSGSTDTSVVPDGRVHLHLGSNDVLYLTFKQQPSLRAYEYVCGTKTDTAITNCGA